MALVRERIGKIDYYSYQSVLEINGKEHNIRTEIGTRGTDQNEFDQRRWIALEEHGKKAQKIWRDSNISKYKFENRPEYHSIEELLEMGFNYRVITGELTPEELKEFEQVLFIRYVYGTTSIEGNSYTESETGDLLNSGLISVSKSPTEAREIENFNAVKKFVTSYRGKISDEFIKNVHSLLMKGIKKPDGKYVDAGEYRKEKSKLTNIWFTPSPPEMIEPRMKYLIEEYNSGVAKSVHPVELASIFHQRFEEIHPFDDGNGRTGREVLNYMLRRSGYPQIYIPPSEHQVYFFTLAEGNNSNFVPLIDFIIHRMYQTLFYFITRTGVGKNNRSEEYKGYYEATSGKEEYKKFIELSDKFGSAESLPR